MARQLSIYISLLLTLICMTACHDTEEYADSPEGNFEALWSILDEHYCFFSYKNVDWDEVHARYKAIVKPGMTREQLFDVLSDMLAELKDGHVNLSSSFATSYYKKWWSDYPQNFSLRLIQQSYFNFDYRQSSGLMYGMLTDNVGYIYIGSFSSPIGEGNLDSALSYLQTASALVIDVRDNGGGQLTSVETVVARFLTEPTLAGYIRHKTGPGHDDFSEPYPIVYKPAGEGRVRWGKPVLVLANRSTFSAANNFVSIMRGLPGVTIGGAVTGGGSGMPYSSELPCGWSVRFSACSILDAEGNSTENGIAPTPGFEAEMDPQAALDGRDTLLDKTVARLLMQGLERAQPL